MADLTELKRVHRELDQALGLVTSLHPVPAGMTAGTAYAIGQAVGHLKRAKASLDRDISDLSSGGGGSE